MNVSTTCIKKYAIAICCFAISAWSLYFGIGKCMHHIYLNTSHGYDYFQPCWSVATNGMIPLRDIDTIDLFFDF